MVRILSVTPGIGVWVLFCMHVLRLRMLLLTVCTSDGGIYFCLHLCKSDEVLSVVTCSVNIWQIVELTSLAQENLKSDTESRENCVGLFG